MSTSKIWRTIRRQEFYKGIQKDDVYKYKCHHCKKKFKESDIKDLRGPWHTKDWTCPHCKYQNVTLKSYDY